ncbi:cleavage polyadenylation factor subunit PFS2 SCDLUD_005000 [Saccharomycodes ludwigii]|uniref:cleavage polyadenylation factor subunit PFS2 n=1 Tax=Saccharomycodes ludwigii TaxID=36035 RepID=UPI001E8708D2|nr:hypothetical protein SCDLUD_005000 [Saccharomycodes ludwigii]KAH3898678.1 hypothetical protein SCDLUD_005000 [Saccharomycodes ludwigii]
MFNHGIMPTTTSKKYSQRRVIDLSSSYGRLVHYHLKNNIPLKYIQKNTSYTAEMMPPHHIASRISGMNNTNKFIHLSSNKIKHVIHAITWTPDGRRLLVTTHSGEFTLWNGNNFSFETIMQAHDNAITFVKYSNFGDWLISGDCDGGIKIWQPNLNMVKQLASKNDGGMGHMDSVRGISFSWDDSKFVTCSDDKSLKIWNFHTGKEERELLGHHWDVKSCDWHSEMGLIVSGSKDNLVKLWDPRMGKNVSSILGFKHTVVATRFQNLGNKDKLVCISKDKSCKIFDLRNHCKEYKIYRNEQPLPGSTVDEVDYCTLEWDVASPSSFTIGSFDGQIRFYDYTLDLSTCYHNIPYAHEKCLTTMAYNPLGHMFATASKDRTIRFWTRARPYDPNAYDEPIYNNKKVTGWYYGINNGISSIRAKTEYGLALQQQSVTSGDQGDNVETGGINGKDEKKSGLGVTANTIIKDGSGNNSKNNNGGTLPLHNMKGKQQSTFTLPGLG